MTGASNISCWRKSKWFPMYVEITMSHCRNHILYKMLLNLCQFSRKWFLKRFRMIHSLFAGQVSPWHSFILKKSKRFFGVLSWADSHRGAILVLVIKKLPGFFFEVLRPLEQHYVILSRRYYLSLWKFTIFIIKKNEFNKVYCLKVL